MRVVLSVHDNESLLTVFGRVDTVDVPALRSRVQDAIEDRGDVLLDMRRAMPISHHLMSALAATRSRAKQLHHRIVVIDDLAGATARGLRREGMHFRIPIYADPAEAAAGLRADRDARARLRSGSHVAPPHAPAAAPDSADVGQDVGADGEVPGSAVRAARARWTAAAKAPSG